MKRELKNLISKLLGKWILDETMLGYKDKYLKVPTVGEYIRVKSLELSAAEIYENEVKGDIAELGVYKGDFAKHINAAFPDRTFYLFDTFEGFDEKDIELEKSLDFSSGTQNFSNTSVDHVLSKFSKPESCVVKKGYFPESVSNLETSFAFVSLDADLYQPIYEGLKYFYPRLSKGGYIFIHDYNNSRYPGVKAAVRKYADENKITFVSLPDAWGTAVVRN